jgi:hypothetical protein
MRQPLRAAGRKRHGQVFGTASKSKVEARLADYPSMPPRRGLDHQSVKLNRTLVIAGVLFGLLAPSASASVRLTYVTPRASPGGVVSIHAHASVAARCSATVRNPKARAFMLPAKRTTSLGQVGWSLRLGRNAPAGRWRVSVRCGAAGTTSGYFTVGTKVPPARVTVVKSGFTEDFSYWDGITYGLVLVNQSAQDAIGVTVSVTFRDTLGRSLISDETDLSLIPARQTFYVSGAALPYVSLDVGSMSVRVKVAKSEPQGRTLPRVSSLLAVDDLGLQTIMGTLTNPYQERLADDATIHAVYFDARGNPIGGGEVDTGAQVQPGATVTFELPVIEVRHVDSAKVSVDPCNAFYLVPASCPALNVQ